MKIALATSACLAALLCGRAYGQNTDPREIVLFPYDDYSIPFYKDLVVSLVSGAKSKTADHQHPNKPVLNVGGPDDPDARISFYGTVLQIGTHYRMWYSGTGRHGLRLICYAESDDALHWTKPKLGLVEYNGSKENNLVSIDGDKPAKGLCALVLFDSEDPDPARRYKMIREDATPGVYWPDYAAVSPDGLRWRSAAGNKPINSTQIEPSGFIRFHGAYYLNGHAQAISHPIPGAQKRTMQTFVSYDFDHWTQAAHMSFRRDNIPPRPPANFEGSRGEQVHVGAGLWNRGNVILGFYGQYHNETDDRRDSIIDLGLIVSHDALHFTEPLPDFKIVRSAEEVDLAEARLIQGEGFLNVGDRSFVYYGIWPAKNPHGPTGVRVATWPRDRLGYFSPNLGKPINDTHCITCVLHPSESGAKVYVNASGLSPEGQLSVQVLDEQFRPLPGYGSGDCLPLKSSGLRLPVVWRGHDSLGDGSQPIRLRIDWIGRDAGDVKLYAAYID